ncbi:MAG TPA: DUF4097 family beta strand repeat-containing protein [Woeseiaceae bacterium]|nr:DUF4097 family beta strand repeat-containing protein [Woeseiaceae bacterium]
MIKATLMGLRLSCLTLFVASAFAADDLPRSVDAVPDGNVSIENTAGSVDVRGWSRNQVEVSGSLGADVEELVVERDGRNVVVRVEIPDRKSRRRHISSDLVVRVPERSSVNVDGVSSDLTVSGVKGALRLKTVSGDIEAQGFEADLDAETVSGDVLVEGSGRANRSRLHSVSGDVEARNLSGEIEAGAVSGDVIVRHGRFGTVRIETVTGDVEFEGELLGNGRMDLETVNGEVDVTFTGSLSARFEIETFNGDIDNCFGPQPTRQSRYAPGKQLVFTEGDGGARVTIQTLNGDLTLCKQ